MSEPVTLAELRGVDLFDDIDDDQLAEWVAVAGVESLEPGGLIFEQGVEPPGLKLLLEGEAIVVLVEGERTEPVGTSVCADVDRGDRRADRRAAGSAHEGRDALPGGAR